jgi:hypothetical protein
MLSFAQLWEVLDQEKSKSSPLMDSGQDTGSMQVVRAGLGLRQESDHTFWDDFINLCSNVDGLADLLGVQRESVSTWASKIRDTLDKVEQHDRQNPDQEDEEQAILPTGDNGAITTKNMGPFGGNK